ncbi:MAG: phospholipid carrier-dependent glycosyltransferase, partial [Nodosilinea sp.]
MGLTRAFLWSGVLGVGTLALALRLWHLGQPHALVFDEVYYVPFALDYLKGNPSFDAHPPLGKYLIALGLWLGQWPAAWLGWPTAEVEGSLVSPLAFRWLNAVVGSAIPLLLTVLAFALSSAYSPQRRRTFALLAGLLLATEGLILVESRLALINIYGIALGLLGQWAWVRAPQSRHPVRWRWAAGVALGAAINVKWNWAGFWLGLLLWDLGSYPLHPSIRNSKLKTQNLSRVVYLGLVPLTTYTLLWMPHLALTGESLVTVHRQLWSIHQLIGAGADHAYCSPWHSWPLMLRPVAYFFERSEGVTTAIHAMGNPVLWWLSTAAVLALALGWLGRQIAANSKTPRRGAACCAST